MYERVAAGSTPEQDPLPLSICCVELVSKTNQVQQDEATETEMEGDVTISERGAEGVDAGGFSGAPLAAMAAIRFARSAHCLTFSLQLAKTPEQWL